MYGDEATESRTGRWSEEEKAAFSEGLKLYGKDWKKISSLVKTRSLTQIRTHAQKFFKRDALSKQPLSSLPPGSIEANKIVLQNGTQKTVRTVTNGENGRSSGRWSEQEQQAFMEGLRKYGKDWKAISQIVQTRSLTQIRTHAQKFFKKGAKDTPMKRSADHACLAHNPAFNSNSYGQAQQGGRYANFATAMPMTMSMSLVTDFTKDVAGERQASQILLGSQPTSTLASVATAQLESEQQQEEGEQRRPSKKLRVCSPSSDAPGRQTKPISVPPQIEITPKNSVAQQAGFGGNTKSDLNNVSPVVTSKQAVDLSSVEGRKPAACPQRKPKPISSPTTDAKIVAQQGLAAADGATDTSANENADADVEPTSTAGSTPFERCREILAQLMRCRHADLFLRPVDPVALNIPDYFKVIACPMDLGTIRQKLGQGVGGAGGGNSRAGIGGGDGSNSRASRSRRGSRERHNNVSNGIVGRTRECEYDSTAEFAADVRLVFDNARKYNGDSHPVTQWAGDILSTFERKWAQMTQQRQASPKSKTKVATSSKDSSVHKGLKAPGTQMKAAVLTTVTAAVTDAPAHGIGTAVSKTPPPCQEQTAAMVNARPTSTLQSTTKHTEPELLVTDSTDTPPISTTSRTRRERDGAPTTRTTPRRVSPRKRVTAAIATATAEAAEDASAEVKGRNTTAVTTQDNTVREDKVLAVEHPKTNATAALGAAQPATVNSSSAKRPVINANSSNGEAGNGTPKSSSTHCSISENSAGTTTTTITTSDAGASCVSSGRVHAPIGNPALHNASDYSAVEAMMQMVNGTARASMHSLGTTGSGSDSCSGSAAGAVPVVAPLNWPPQLSQPPTTGSGIDQLTLVMDSRSIVDGGAGAVHMDMGIGMDTSATPLGRQAAAWLRMSPQEQQHVLHLLDAPVHVYYFGQYLREHKPSVLRLLLFVADLHKMHGDVQFLMQQSQREHRVHSQHESKQSTLTHMHNFHKYIVAAYFRADSTNSLCGICPGLDKYSASQAVGGNTIIVDCVYRTALAMLHQWLQPYSQSEECKAAVAPPN